MNTGNNGNNVDPLGLSELPVLDPPADGWFEIKAALEEPAQPSKRQWGVSALAIAASLALVIAISIQQLSRETAEPAETQLADSASSEPASAVNDTTVEDLIAMSQLLEHRLRNLRDNTGSMPAKSAVYVAELEDLVAHVDGAISYNPDSLDLWGQRVNLLLDIEYIYQHQFEREYGRMASL